MSARPFLLSPFAVALLASSVAFADPVLRHQSDQRGNFVIVGNTLGLNCTSSTPTPVVGTLGDCGTTGLSDSAPDVFWRSDAPDAGEALADSSVSASQARSTAMLQLPPGAVVTYARLYWAARTDGSVAGANATIERPGTFSTQVTSDNALTGVRNGNLTYYQSSVDVTALVREHGPGAFRVGNIDSVNLVDRSEDSTFISWGLVVFYSLDSDPPRQLTLFDGLEQLPRADNSTSLTSTISGFLAPAVGFDARLGVIAYEGDSTLSGDQFFFNNLSTGLSHGTGSQTNFFSGSKTLLGSPVSVAGDLPQLTGDPGSNTGVDYHVLDVTDRMSPGDTTATVRASTNSDFFVLGVFVTAIATLKPVFTETFKTYVDLNGGDIRQGDIIQYDVTTKNTGTDVGVNVVMSDPLPPQVTFVPGSLELIAGPTLGPLTDVPGDDAGDYDANTRTVRARLGTGATAALGGNVGVNETVTVRFRVVVDVATGEINNQAKITAQGQQGAVQGIAATDFISDSTFTGAGLPTTFPVDECSTHNDCPTGRPLCDTAANPNRCVTCLTATDCQNPTPVCNTDTGTCAGCNQDSDCTDADFPSCNRVTHACATPPVPPESEQIFQGGGCSGTGLGLGGVGPLMLSIGALVYRLRQRRA